MGLSHWSICFGILFGLSKCTQHQLTTHHLSSIRQCVNARVCNAPSFSCYMYLRPVLEVPGAQALSAALKPRTPGKQLSQRMVTMSWQALSHWRPRTLPSPPVSCEMPSCSDRGRAVPFSQALIAASKLRESARLLCSIWDTSASAHGQIHSGQGSYLRGSHQALAPEATTTLKGA